MSEQKIHKDMTFGELLRNFPRAAPILSGYGLHCVGCHIGVMETIEQGVMAHGLGEETLDKMIDDLNQNAL
jgi:hydroxylamine reductase